jgi:hypothetical protein
MNRLRAFVERAQTNGLLIRIDTLDGATEQELSCRGWFRNYNFGSLDAARNSLARRNRSSCGLHRFRSIRIVGSEVLHHTAEASPQHRP